MSIKKEALWVFTSTGVTGVVQLVVLALLASTGGSEVLGQLAIINVVLALAFLLQDMGLSSYFIHRQTLSHAERSTLFAINLVLGTIVAVIVLLAAYPIGLFYDSSVISTGLALVAVNFVFIGANAQYQAHFIKSLKNHSLAKIEISSKLIMLLSSACLIFQFELGIAGYLYAVIIASISKLCLSLLVAPKHWHPRWSFDLSIVKPAMHYGGFQMGSQIINQLRTQADQLIIGKWLGIEVLGIYSLAKELVMQPIKLVTPITSKLVLPRLAKVQSSSAHLADIFDKASKVILSVNLIVYMSATIAIFYLMPLFFAKDYSHSFSIYTLLLLIGLLRPIGSLFGALAQSQGASNIEFSWNVIASVVSIVALLIAMPFHSLEAFAIAMSLSQLLLSSYAVVFFSKRLNAVSVLPHMLKIAGITLLYVLFLLVTYFL